MFGFFPYKSFATRKKDAEKTIIKMTKSGKKIFPVKIEGKKIANRFWGIAWCDNLESFSDYESRLPRGRSYVRHGSVIHLGIEKGKIEAFVQGSSLYNVNIDIKPVDSEKWNIISNKCAGTISSLQELLQGELSFSVIKTFTDQENGLFPQPEEITLKCSCTDSAYMCKHVAAVLYAVGTRLDSEPELLFILRSADHMALINSVDIQAAFVDPANNSNTTEDHNLETLFGVAVETQEKTFKSVKQVEIAMKPKATKKVKIKPKQKVEQKQTKEKISAITKAKKTKTVIKAKTKKKTVKQTKPLQVAKAVKTNMKAKATKAKTQPPSKSKLLQKKSTSKSKT